MIAITATATTTKFRKIAIGKYCGSWLTKLDAWVTKKGIKSKFKGQDSTLDNALHALRDRQIILDKEGERGVYRLQHKGFAWWIKLYTTSDKELQQPLPNMGETVQQNS